MLTSFILATVAGVAIAAVFFCEDEANIATCPPSRSVFAAALSCVAAAAFLVVHSAALIEQGYERRQWPQTEGEVKSSMLVGKADNQPEVEYTYRVEERSFSGRTNFSVPNFGSSSMAHEVAVKTLERYPIGQSIRVFFNPEQPHVSRIKPGPTWDQYTQLSLGTFLYGCGMFFLFRSIRNRARVGK